MPLPVVPTAKLQVSIAGGAPESGFVEASFGQTMALSAQTTALWQSVRYDIYDFPPGMSVPAGWSTDPVTGAYFFAPSNPTVLPPIVTLPSSGSTTWGPLMLRLRCNQNPLALNPDGTPNTGFNPGYTDESTFVVLPSPNLKLFGMGFNATTQYDAMRGFAGLAMHDLRLIDAAAGGASASGLFVSPVDIAMGAGLAGIVNNSGNKTRGIGFGAIQASHYCLGGRGYWAGPATTLTVVLWDGSTNGVAATVNIAVGAAQGLWLASFASPYALQAGRSMAITAWDTAGLNYTTYNGQQGTGTAPMGAFMPYSGLAGMIGPFVEVCGFGGAASSASALWGLTSAGNAVPTTAGTDTVGWNPIEPMVV